MQHNYGIPDLQLAMRCHVFHFIWLQFLVTIHRQISGNSTLSAGVFRRVQLLGASGNDLSC